MTQLLPSGGAHNAVAFGVVTMNLLYKLPIAPLKADTSIRKIKYCQFRVEQEDESQTNLCQGYSCGVRALDGV